MLRIAVCVNDVETCSEIEALVLAYDKGSKKQVHVEVFYSAEELYRELSEGLYCDMIFLGAELKGLTGIQLGEKIRNELKNEIVQIVYISSSYEIMQEAFRIRPLHCLRKPLNKEEIASTIDKARELLDLYAKNFVYRMGCGEYKVPISQILYFKRDKSTTEIHLFHESKNIYQSLEGIRRDLQQYRFISCHQSYLVNYSCIKEFYYEELVMINGEHIPISQRKRKEIRELHKQFKKEDFVKLNCLTVC